MTFYSFLERELNPLNILKWERGTCVLDLQASFEGGRIQIRLGFHLGLSFHAAVLARFLWSFSDYK